MLLVLLLMLLECLPVDECSRICGARQWRKQGKCSRLEAWEVSAEEKPNFRASAVLAEKPCGMHGPDKRCNR